MGVALDEPVAVVPPLEPPYARPKLKFDEEPSTAGVGAPLVAAK
jgi:hypothetical protein